MAPGAELQDTLSLQLLPDVLRDLSADSYSTYVNNDPPGERKCENSHPCSHQGFAER